MKPSCTLLYRKHKLPEGWCGGPPYFQIANIVTDGIGREHAYLKAECARCGEKFTAAMVHLPAGTAELWIAEQKAAQAKHASLRNLQV